MHKKLTFFLAFLLFFITQNSFALEEQNTIQTQDTTMLLDDFSEDEFADFGTENKIEIYDPFEKMNRKIYAFNDGFDRYFFQYVARAYRQSLPKPTRKMIGNFLNNLSLPFSALNSFAQGKVDNGLATISNFLINSTIGVLGIFEIASEKGILYNHEDFGQTFGHYNIGSGAYLMIPILGPSSTRDFTGFAIDRAISPLGFNVFEFGNDENLFESEYLIGLTILSGVNTRASLTETIDDLRKDSFDPYATIRSAYLQRREAEVKK